MYGIFFAKVQSRIYKHQLQCAWQHIHEGRDNNITIFQHHYFVGRKQGWAWNTKDCKLLTKKRSEERWQSVYQHTHGIWASIAMFSCACIGAIHLVTFRRIKTEVLVRHILDCKSNMLHHATQQQKVWIWKSSLMRHFTCVSKRRIFNPKFAWFMTRQNPCLRWNSSQSVIFGDKWDEIILH